MTTPLPTDARPDSAPGVSGARPGPGRIAGLDIGSPARRPAATRIGSARPETPAQAYSALMDGNARFAGSAPHYPNHRTGRREVVAAAQDPFAIVFGCSDSRVPPELVFDRGLGDLFVLRNSAHVMDPVTVGTIDHALTDLSTPLLAVVGHSSCGAVGAAVEAHRAGEAPEGNVRQIVERVLPSVSESAAAGGDSIDECVVAHVLATVRALPEVSDLVRERLQAGSLGVVGLVYRLETGRVERICHLGRIDG